MSVDWNKVFNKIKINDDRKDFSCYDTQIRNGVDKQTIISKTCNYILENPALTNEELKVINGEALLKAVKDAVESFDIKGEYKLGQHINNMLNMRRPDIIEDDILKAGYKNKSIVKEYNNFKKDLKKAKINWDELSSNEQVEAAKQFGISELQLRNMFEYQDFTNSDRLYSTDECDEESTIDIPDNRPKDLMAHMDYVYSFFSYVFKNSKEKKHGTFKMIDSNGVRNVDFDPLEFIDFVDMEYIRYADKYKTYEDADIVSYKYFDGKRSTDKEVSTQKFKNEKSKFSTKYRTPYKKLQKKFRETYRNI